MSRRKPASQPAGALARSPLAPALAALDSLLADALPRAEAEFTADGALRAVRSLHISAESVRTTLTSMNRVLPGAGVGSVAGKLRRSPAFRRLIETFKLNDAEAVILLIALGPELDLRYERIYGYLQDDATRRRPTVDLALNLVCSSELDRNAARPLLGTDGRLVRQGLVSLIADPNFAAPSLLAHYVVPDEMLVRHLSGDPGLHSFIANSCALSKSRQRLEDLTQPAAVVRQLRRVADRDALVWLSGPRGVGKAAAAAALASERAMAMLTFDADRIATETAAASLRIAVREANLRGACLLIRRADGALLSTWRFDEWIEAAEVPVFVTSRQRLPEEWRSLFSEVELPLPGVAMRSQLWSESLGREHKLDATVIERLARRFRLAPVQIRAAAQAFARSGGTDADAEAAARAQCGEALRSLATRIDPRAAWEDIVLPQDSRQQLQEICERVDYNARVFEDWGFGGKSARGRGTTALFCGGSGTGKTMAAEVLASTLGLNLYRIDLARIVSKYIGETEKNLERVFTAADGANAILFFDEADALFGKRSEVKDSRDRYANLEVSYLLQKMEEYDGVAILATNLAENMDDAFTRRLGFRVQFPFPDERARLQIWQRAWPPGAPIGPTVDRAALARNLKLTGGGIRNVALASAFAAAGNGGVVEEAHVRHAVMREFQKSGRSLAETRS